MLPVLHLKPLPVWYPITLTIISQVCAYPWHMPCLLMETLVSAMGINWGLPVLHGDVEYPNLGSHNITEIMDLLVSNKIIACKIQFGN